MTTTDNKGAADDIVVPRQKILVVDDVSENLVAMEVVLEELDCTIVTALSGQEALGHLLKDEFALVLLDVQMPEMDGFEVAEIMGSNKRTANIPIIFITANSRDEINMRKGYSAGAVDYLYKPIEPTVLCSKVRFFLQLDYQKKRLEIKLNKLRESEHLLYAAYGQDKQPR